MKLRKYSYFILFSLLLLWGGSISSQIISGNAYMIDTYIEVAIHGTAGHEGTADWIGHHSRGGTPDVPFGFVASPDDFTWTDYNGDYFTAGSPENGFGLEINGVNYSNNAWNATTTSAYLQEIPMAPGGDITYSEDGNCITVEWEGRVAGVTINVKYHLTNNNKYYSTEITLTNTTSSDLTDVYYYRNIDPDNNHAITGNYSTTNTIVSQVDDDCTRAVVKATQASPWSSYLGLGAIGANFRVSHGGFANRSGSDIWNGVGPLTGIEGATETGDWAISLAHKSDLAAGESINFTYTVILDGSQLEESLESLYYVTYMRDGETGGEVSPCNPLTIIHSCRGHEVTLYINGPDLDGYDWVWYPTLEETDSIVVSPLEETTYTVIGTSVMGCISGEISINVSIVFTLGPQIEVIDPGPICLEFDITTLEYEHDSESEDVHCVFLTEQPDSASQTEPAFDGPMMGPEDEVWLMCGDTVTGCYSTFLLHLNFIGEGSAGLDSTITICGGPGTIISLEQLISDSANVQGRYEEDAEYTGRLNDSTGVYNGSNIYGTFVFLYILDGLDPCPADTAIFTVHILEGPSPRFSYAVNGVSSEDGLVSTCIVNEIDFFNESTIEEPGIIVDYKWYFGDGDSSLLENPSHTYEFTLDYTITLTVTSDNGCKKSFSRLIKIYDEPPFDFLFEQPICNGSNDGFIITELPCDLGPYSIEVWRDDGTRVNSDGEDGADSLIAGTYYIFLEDASGCISRDTVTIDQPPPLKIYYHIQHPPCMGDSGYAVVDSVAGETMNNPVRLTWDPNPAGIEGYDADSSYWMVAGEYSVLATDAKGCTDIAYFELIDPPPFYFTEWGFDTAYCRKYNYQSGNGVVYAAATGGKPNYIYEWTYLVDGTTSNNTTWGGRNPGDHLITVTDSGGCVLTKIITVDSVNPKASFTIESAVLDDNCAGTADVQVEFTNTSTYYANPNSPSDDTLFMWDLYRTEVDDWIISHDINEKFDTLYEARGESYQVDVCLIAYNKNGCPDTACKKITIFEPPELNPVNIFSPNDNGINDYFTFKNYSKGIHDFQCIITNRWGIEVAEIRGIENGWDGKNKNGEPCADGVYFFTYVAIADNRETFSGQGTVTIVDSLKE